MVEENVDELLACITPILLAGSGWSQGFGSVLRPADASPRRHWNGASPQSLPRRERGRDQRHGQCRRRARDRPGRQPRAVDGNSGGIARCDIGAYEAPLGTFPSPTATTIASTNTTSATNDHQVHDDDLDQRTKPEEHQ